MKTFRVLIDESRTWEYLVKAKSSKEAREKVLTGQAVNKGKVVFEEVTGDEVTEYEGGQKGEQTREGDDHRRE